MKSDTVRGKMKATQAGWRVRRTNRISNAVFDLSDDDAKPSVLFFYPSRSSDGNSAAAAAASAQCRHSGSGNGVNGINGIGGKPTRRESGIESRRVLVWFQC
ncbi:hypothetical protein ANO14919_037180 [Xylariales sp. No.14919]|nr:hypothetical protein ANO14919_037180 [Xylariales sp. No.14919]